MLHTEPLAPSFANGATERPKATKVDLSGEEASRTPTIVWGLLVALIGGMWWFAFHHRPRWWMWLLGAAPFAVTLYIFYGHLERLLPSNY